MRRGIFISVRTGSERLPNKSILKIKDKFTIEYVIDSVKKSNYADKIILCTTKNSQDDILCDIAKKRDIDFYRGDEHNKFKRWYWASVEFDIDEIVTADGDDLFYDHRLSDMCFEQIEDNDLVDGQGLYNDVYGFKSKTIENIINISRGDVVEPHEIVSFLQDKNFKIHKLKNKFVSSNETLITRERHRQHLIQCVDHLKNFSNKNDKKDFDKAAEDLRLATKHLGMIVGKVDVEEILGSIFNDFCIGK